MVPKTEFVKLSSQFGNNESDMHTHLKKLEDASQVEIPSEFTEYSTAEIARSRKRFGMLISTASYPIIGFAVWTGAWRGHWPVAAIIAALAVVTSFIGWDIYSVAVRDSDSLADRSTPSVGNSNLHSTVVLIVRLGAISVPLYSYFAIASSFGLPMPETPLGLVATISVVMSGAFAILKTES